MKTKVGTLRKIENLILILCGALLAAPLAYAQNSEPGGLDKAQLPNIIFFVMDDVGVDQMRLYGYGDPGVPTRSVDPDDVEKRRTRLPNIEAIAAKGVTFTNAWAMPTCSPSRATFFTGRLPLRDNVVGPILPPDLANSTVSPDALTLPKLLKTKGYISGAIGKMHLSSNGEFLENTPLGNEAYRKLGFDYFNGTLDDAPFPIDTQAGLNTVAPGTYSCGFIPNLTTDPDNGANEGTCYYANGTSQVMTTSTYATPGRACLESGGIFDPASTPSPSHVDFSRDNGYYTGRWVENLEDGTTRTHPPGDTSVDPAEYRGYRSIVEANRAIAWINEKQQGSKPWMATIGWSSAHAPWQQVPTSILPDDSVDANGLKCTVGYTIQDWRVLMQQMEEGLDHELGRILVETGIASRNGDGSLNYDPEASNTLIVIIGDNGTFSPVVNQPFDPTRSKGSPYQAGVWVPLIAAGPMVKAPGRQVSDMVNGVDLYKLFAELAGINADTVVPKAQRLDAQGMLSYLTKAKGPAVRATNITMQGDNLRAEAFREFVPCAVPTIGCTNLFFPTKPECEKNAGIWYGPDSSVPGVPAEGLQDCCAVNAFREARGESILRQPSFVTGIRDVNYKLIKVDSPDCATPAPRGTASELEFYRIDEEGPTPLLDTEENNLLKDGATVDDLTKGEKKAYQNLAKRLDKWKDTVVESCLGDGNLDLVVDAQDIAGFEEYAATPLGTGYGKSSWYDFNYDGLTDQTDLDIIYSHWGQRCKPKDHAAVK